MLAIGEGVQKTLEDPQQARAWWEALKEIFWGLVNLLWTMGYKGWLVLALILFLVLVFTDRVPFLRRRG